MSFWQGSTVSEYCRCTDQQSSGAAVLYPAACNCGAILSKKPGQLPRACSSTIPMPAAAAGPEITGVAIANPTARAIGDTRRMSLLHDFPAPNGKGGGRQFAAGWSSDACNTFSQ